MTIDYISSAALMTDPSFNNRSQIACLHFAQYIIGEDPTTAAHTTRLKWAQQTVASPAAAVAQIMTTLVMDAKVQAVGSTILDADLQTAVETSINKFF